MTNPVCYGLFCALLNLKCLPYKGQKVIYLLILGNRLFEFDLVEQILSKTWGFEGCYWQPHVKVGDDVVDNLLGCRGSQGNAGHALYSPSEIP